jgi:CHASE3 domain sensor protein
MITWLIGLLAARLKIVALLSVVIVLLLLAACASLPQKQTTHRNGQLKPLSSVESAVECGDAQAVVVISIPEGMEVHRPDFIQWMNETGRLN